MPLTKLPTKKIQSTHLALSSGGVALFPRQVGSQFACTWRSRAGIYTLARLSPAHHGSTSVQTRLSLRYLQSNLIIWKCQFHPIYIVSPWQFKKYQVYYSSGFSLPQEIFAIRCDILSSKLPHIIFIFRPKVFRPKTIQQQKITWSLVKYQINF